MSTDHTANYNLSQWQPQDNFLRAEFNENLQKIDGAIAGKCEMTFCSFTGNGATERVISLPFRPKVVLFEGVNGFRSSDDRFYYGGILMDGYPAKDGCITICDQGVKLKNDSYHRINENGKQYYLIAFR